jgi:hypothetical protein
MPYSTLFQPSFWQCSCRSVTGNFPVQEDGATKARGFGAAVVFVGGSFADVTEILGFPCLPFEATLVSGSGSGGFGGFGGFGVFFPMPGPLSKKKKLDILDNSTPIAARR